MAEEAVLYLRAEVVAYRQEVEEEASCHHAYHILAEEAEAKYRSL